MYYSSGFTGGSYLVEAASAKVVGDHGESVRRALQLVVKVIVQVLTLLLRPDYIQHLPTITQQRVSYRAGPYSAPAP